MGAKVEIKRTWNWSATLGVIVMHVAAAYAVFYGVAHGFSLGSWLLFILFNFLTIFGISVGYHRFVTHGSFECRRFIKLFLLICGGLAIQGHAIGWARNHRTHHLYSDRKGDPHSPREGFWHAHIGWFMHKYTVPSEKTMCQDLLKDRLIVSQKYWVPVAGAAGFIVPFLFFGWEGALLAGVLRLVFASHAIWAINSVCHTWGERPYATKDDSTNNLILAWLIPSGEPFHNNHHADPKCAYLGWRWFDPDAGKWLLQILEMVRISRFRLVWNIRKPRPDLMDQLYNKRKAEAVPASS